MHRFSQPTQKQIAARLGVLQALVSRALSGRAREIGAAPATIEKIRRAASEWNYQPSATALALLGAPTRTHHSVSLKGNVIVRHSCSPPFQALP
jgi:DNA-binding LacI/PurR family transcriptional regulator